MVELQLRQEDARLVYLAVAYHLGRPGSELDPLTKQQVEHGLAEISRDLQPQLEKASASITLNSDQVTRLVSAMYGSMTELKAYPMLGIGPDGTGRQSSVRGFDTVMRHLYPEVNDDIEVTADLAERMIMLKRRLDPQLLAATSETEEPPAAALPEHIAEKEPPPKRGFWPFRK